MNQYRDALNDRSIGGAMNPSDRAKDAKLINKTINTTRQRQQQSAMQICRSSRVLILSDAAPHRNGVGAYYQDLMQHLSEHVEAIDIISPEIINGEWQGGWMLPMPGDHTQKFCIPNLVSLMRRIRQFQPTVIVAPTPGPFGMFAASYARHRQIGLIAGFHTWFEKLAELYCNKVRGAMTRSYFEVSNRLIFKQAAVLANSVDMVNIAQSIGAKNAKLMGTPVAKDFIDTPLSQPPVQAKRFLFAGRLAAEKNLAALMQVIAAHPDLSLDIAGDGPMRAEVEAMSLTHPNIRYLGWLSRPELINAMDQNDALVLPSCVESFGTIALEAMSRERLVVISSECGIGEWSELAEYLTKFPIDSSIASALTGLSQLSPQAIKQKALAARQAVLRHNHWNTSLWLQVIQAEHNRAKQPVVRSKMRYLASRLRRMA